MKVSISRYGTKGVLLSWPVIIDEGILSKITQFIDVIQDDENILDIHHAYHEVLIQYKSKVKDFNLLKQHLQATLLKHKKVKTIQATHWTIPVCYDKSLVQDLDSYLEQKEMRLSKLISLHTHQTYTVYFTGFLPGFLYLGTLDSDLFINRKSKPSRLIKAGTVAIGGAQTGIYPQDSPGGWYGIGYTPISFFNPRLDVPTWAKPGDKITFESVDKDRILNIKAALAKGKYILKSAAYDG